MVVEAWLEKKRTNSMEEGGGNEGTTAGTGDSSSTMGSDGKGVALAQEDQEAPPVPLDQAGKEVNQAHQEEGQWVIWVSSVREGTGQAQ